MNQDREAATGAGMGMGKGMGKGKGKDEDEGGGVQHRVCPIVMASDENFAMPLATMLRSLAESNSSHWPLNVTVLTDAFSHEGRRLVQASLPTGSVQLRWQVIDLTRYEHFRSMSYQSKMIFARLQIDDVFDIDVERVIYLDADMLVLNDILPLAKVDLQGAILGAVADRYIDGARRRGLEPNPGGVPNVSRYFNSGVLVIDLGQWRQRQIAQRAVRYLADFPYSPYPDQDALNVACDSAWCELNAKWNFQQHLAFRITGIPRADRPAIVHFITSAKPWKPSSLNCNASLYESFRDRTAFRRNRREKMAAFGETFLESIRQRWWRVASGYKRFAKRLS